MHNRLIAAGRHRSTEPSHQALRRILFLAASIVVAVTLPLIAVRALSGDGAASLTAEPAAVIAGTTTTVIGTGLEPNADRVLTLDGGGVTVEFGSVKTDANGTFSKTLTIPGHLPSGSYELREVGASTLATTIDVAAAAAGGASGNRTDATVVTASDSSGHLAVSVAAALVIVFAAAVVAWRAERLRRQLRPRVRP